MPKPKSVNKPIPKAATNSDTLLQDQEGLAIMDAVAEVIADRYELPLLDVKRKIQKQDCQQLYEGCIGPAIDAVAKVCGWE